MIHHHRLNDSHQLNKEVAQEEMKDRDRVSEHLHVHLRMILIKVQQPRIHKIAWATVQGHIKNEKSHEEVVHNNSDRIHHSKEERKLLLENNRVNHQRPRITSLLIQMKTMKSLNMNQELLQIPNLLDQYFLIILVMKTVNTETNIVHKDGTPKGPYSVQISLYLTNEEHWTTTPATHKYAAAAGSFCSSITEDGEQQVVCNLITMPSVQRSLYLNEATNGHEIIKTEVPDGVDGQTRDMFGTLCGYLRKSCRNKSQHEISCAKGSICPSSSRILQTICWSKTSCIQILAW